MIDIGPAYADYLDSVFGIGTPKNYNNYYRYSVFDFQKRLCKYIKKPLTIEVNHATQKQSTIT